MSQQAIASSTVFKRGSFLSNMLYPNITGIDKVRKKFRLYCWCVFSPKVTDELMCYFNDPLLEKLITVYPSFIEKPLKHMAVFHGIKNKECRCWKNISNLC